MCGCSCFVSTKLYALQEVTHLQSTQMQLREEAGGTLVGATTKASAVHRVNKRRKRGRRCILDRISTSILVVVRCYRSRDPFSSS
jgi:hypothetical protein